MKLLGIGFLGISLVLLVIGLSNNKVVGIRSWVVKIMVSRIND